MVSPISLALRDIAGRLPGKLESQIIGGIVKRTARLDRTQNQYHLAARITLIDGQLEKVFNQILQTLRQFAAERNPQTVLIHFHRQLRHLIANFRPESLSEETIKQIAELDPQNVIRPPEIGASSPTIPRPTIPAKGYPKALSQFTSTMIEVRSGVAAIGFESLNQNILQNSGPYLKKLSVEGMLYINELLKRILIELEVLRQTIVIHQGQIVDTAFLSMRLGAWAQELLKEARRLYRIIRAQEEQKKISKTVKQIEAKVGALLGKTPQENLENNKEKLEEAKLLIRQIRAIINKLPATI